MYALESYSGIISDELGMTRGDLTEWEEFSHYYSLLSPQIQTLFLSNQDIRGDYSTIFECIHILLEKRIAPRLERILAEGKRIGTDFADFVDEGGRLEDAMGQWLRIASDMTDGGDLRDMRRLGLLRSFC